METTKTVAHTPGPWVWPVTSPTIIAGEGGVYSPVCTVDLRPQHEANARLIAAAPELLAFVKEWEHQITDGGILDKLDGWQREFAEEARRVIAAAEGRTP